jgi:competence protein ComEA
MRWSRPRVDPETVAVARRRLATLSAELAQARPAEDADPDHAPPMPVDADDEAPAAMQRLSLNQQDLGDRPPGRHAGQPAGGAGSLVDRLTGRLALAAPSRLGVTSMHVVVVALVAVACVAAGAWLLLRSQPRPVSSPPKVPMAAAPLSPAAPSITGTSAGPPLPGTAPATPGASPSPGQPTVLVVDVAGKVRTPGIVELPLGARVVDALSAAGGARPDVRLAGLNLARPLVDGEQLLVGVRPARLPGATPPSAAGPTTSGPTAPTGLVDLNTASQEQLETLPGIGPVTALAILTWRDENGGFTSVDELLEVSGIGEVTLAEVRPFVTV